MPRLEVWLFTLAALAQGPPAKPLTARQVIERIQKQVGVPWDNDTVDTFKAGDPDTAVTGVATSFAATMDVLQRASASGKNLIVAHEPTFYNHQDKTAGMENDEVLAAKRAFIEKHHMVVWRFHDHWHRRNPDGILTGTIEALGWEKFRSPQDPRLFIFPETTLGRFAGDTRDRLKIRTLRVVGDPRMKFTKVSLIPGAAGADSQIHALERPEVEVLVVGESREWETVEYVRDAVSEGKRKALILLGHVPSEEAGMKECARWLKTFLPGVPIEFIPAGEPFWTPK
ncbi:MAG: Nif3-like dinuclear metal center hexameric protein [Acidobacteriota bacterium]|nr:Nif3-like dinuclear metal center hexameric protein [Acidobacteriota bacterium]